MKGKFLVIAAGVLMGFCLAGASRGQADELAPGTVQTLVRCSINSLIDSAIDIEVLQSMGIATEAFVTEYGIAGKPLWKKIYPITRIRNGEGYVTYLSRGFSLRIDLYARSKSLHPHYRASARIFEILGRGSVMATCTFPIVLQ